MKIFTTLLLLVLLSSIVAIAQTMPNKQLAKKYYYPMATIQNFNTTVFEKKSEGIGANLFTQFFVFYKRNISSQDNQHCAFQPSCSVYTILNIKKHGWLPGLVIGFDRLTRCNGLSAIQYKINPQLKLLVDEVE
jgi:putative component of membrane protein insertase Oxa1/YidC/SpoIIIJ protein YidD